MILSKHHKICVALTLVNLISACGIADKFGKKDTKDDTSTPAAQSTDPAMVPLPDDGGFLKLTDFDAPADYTLNPVTDSNLITSLNKSSKFYNNQPKGTPTPSLANDCYKAPESATWVANKVSAKVSYTLDNSECLKKFDSDYTYSKYTNVQKFYWYITCVGGDLSKLNGTKVSADGSGASTDSNADNLASSCQKSSTHSEVVIEYDSDGVNQNGDRATMKVRSIDYSGSKTLGTCNDTTAASKITRNDDCMDVSKTTYDISLSNSGTVISDEKNYDLEKVTYKGLILDSSSTQNVWPEAGKITVQKNDWNGEVTATGSKVAPTYSLKNVTSGDVKTGNLTATPAD